MMNASSNPMGITDIARRLVMSGTLEEEAATKGQGVADHLADKHLVTPGLIGNEVFSIYRGLQIGHGHNGRRH